jgi:hypothetical protein
LPSLDEEEHIEATQLTVSTVKKSQASMLAGCRRRNAGQLTAVLPGAAKALTE